ncbi:MAG: hypothetical protein K2M19_09030 [Muribaculaceae bacterium]|nr:hypothetical protein [Muribaculaceae bacterium]
MKKAFLTLALAAVAAGASGQVVQVASVEKVSLPQEIAVNIPRVSPDGSFVVLSTNTDNALYRVSLAGGSPELVATSGSALELAFSPDSKAVVFKSSTTDRNRLRYYHVQSVDLEKGTSRALTSKKRHCASFSVSPAGQLSLADGGKFSARSFSGAKVKSARPVVGINRGHLEITTPDGRTRNLDPQGRGSYLWPSVSPDGTKIVYYLSGHGCYVCDIDGSNVRELGFVHAPQWLGDNAVIGCQDQDNGVYVTSSSIVAADLDGTIQTLTDPSLLGMNPSASADGKTIAFASADGKLYRINLK